MYRLLDVLYNFQGKSNSTLSQYLPIPLQKTSGRSDALPRWSVLGAVRALKGWAWRNAFLRRARVMDESWGKWRATNKAYLQG